MHAVEEKFRGNSFFFQKKFENSLIFFLKQKPPPDYKPPKKSRKIYLPETMNEPDSNYIGMIIGPRGTTQKSLEQKSGCKISIRGKGSTKVFFF